MLAFILHSDEIPIIPPALSEQPQETGGFLFPVCQTRFENK
nr:MAG TPA: hypothetical protein [Caudoviricetes sp.]